VADAVNQQQQQQPPPPGESQTVAVNMISRFIGLVVVPGRHITKIEVDEGYG
jgi:hypothetical protein